MSIGQVSRLLGVPVPTLRSWEIRYGIGPTGRTRGGHRRYSQAQIQALRALSAAIGRGLAPRSAAEALGRTIGEPGDRAGFVKRLLERAAAGEQAGVLDLLNESEERLGLEQTVDGVLVPALRELGSRWELGLVDVATEHLATAAARRWIAGHG